MSSTMKLISVLIIIVFIIHNVFGESKHTAQEFREYLTDVVKHIDHFKENLETQIKGLDESSKKMTTDADKGKVEHKKTAARELIKGLVRLKGQKGDLLKRFDSDPKNTDMVVIQTYWKDSEKLWDQFHQEVEVYHKELFPEDKEEY